MKKAIIAVLSIIFMYSMSHASERSHVKDGIKKYDKKEFVESQRSFEAAKKESPNNPIINFDIGSTLYKQGEYEKAKNEYGKALITKDKRLKQKTFYNLGNTSFKDNKFDEAIEYYKRALDIYPSDINSKYNLEFTKMIKANPQMKKKQEEKNKKEKKGKQKQAQAQKKEGEKKKGQKDKESDEQKDQKKQKSSKEKEGKKEMSKEDAERLLQYFKDAEKDTAKKKRMKTPRLPRVEQDW